MLMLQAWIAAVLLVPAVMMQEPAKSPAPDPLAALRPLVGAWKGPSSGEPGQGTSERTYQFEFDGKFLSVWNKGVYPAQEKNPKGEVHQDTGLFSYDKARKKLVFRQFHSEGFVNQYVGEVSADGKTVVFTSEAIENIAPGWRARETYRFVGPDELVETFELAAPGKQFEPYSECKLHRVAAAQRGR